MSPVILHPSFASEEVDSVLTVIAASQGIARFKTHLKFWMWSHSLYIFEVELSKDVNYRGKGCCWLSFSTSR